MKLATSPGGVYFHRIQDECEKIRMLHDAGFSCLDFSFWAMKPNSPFMTDDWKAASQQVRSCMDEIGMEGYHDPFNRQPYPWGKEDASVLTFFKDAMALRTEYPMLRDAYYKGVLHDNGVFVFERFSENERMRVVVNMSTEPYVLSIDGGEVLSTGNKTAGDSLMVAPKDFALLYYKV